MLYPDTVRRVEGAHLKCKLLSVELTNIMYFGAKGAVKVQSK